jgi:hypothetical protein
VPAVQAAMKKAFEEVAGFAPNVKIERASK